MTAVDDVRCTAVRPWAPPRVGMVGAGQLARMTHRAAIDLGIGLEVLADRIDDPAVAAGAVGHLASGDTIGDLCGLADRVAVVTFDHERTAAEQVAVLEATGCAVRPGSAALRLAQDKLYARRTLADVGVPVPPFAAVDRGLDTVAGAARRWGWPLVLKARFGGYDGRGVRVVHSLAEAGGVLGPGTGQWLVEAAVDIATEVAVVLARRPSGQRVVYPLVETCQVDGICRELVMPALLSRPQRRAAVAVATSLADGVDATGIMAVELFVTTGGDLLVNEVAVRPHNSGHATLEANVTSQFENHLRAILDWPLGATDLVAPAAAMVNLLGPADGSDPAQRLPAALDVPGAHVHLYGKEPAPGRKLGHVTALGPDRRSALRTARRAAALLSGTP